MRITVACPEAMRSDANNLAMVISEGPGDAYTFDALNWADADRNLYACASFEASEEWVQGAMGPLERPAWDVGTLDPDTGEYGAPYIINMAGAERAQDALVLWPASDDPGDPPQASLTTLTAIIGDDGRTSAALMGLVLTDDLPPEDE